jgi:hypothetical protein
LALVSTASFFIIALALFGAYLVTSLQNAETVHFQQSESQYTGTTCFQSAQNNVFLFVINDTTRAPIQGVGVSGEVKWLCGVQASPTLYTTASQGIGSIESGANNVPLYLGSIIGNYSLALSYGISLYHVSFGAGAQENVNVTVGLPSLNITEISCTYGGAMCFRTLIYNSTTIIPPICEYQPVGCDESTSTVYPKS